MKKSPKPNLINDVQAIGAVPPGFIEKLNGLLSPCGFSVTRVRLKNSDDPPDGEGESPKTSFEVRKTLGIPLRGSAAKPEFLELTISGPEFQNSDIDQNSDIERNRLIDKLLDSTLSSAFSLSIAEEESKRDPMTGLLNKGAFLELLGKTIESARGGSHLDDPASDRLVDQGGSVHVMMADIDDFKMFNSLFGYVVGDAVIRAVALILMDIRPRTAGRAAMGQEPMTRSGESLKSKIVARYGGEEFVAAINGFPAREAMEFCENFREKVRREATEMVRRELTRDRGIAAEVIGSIPSISVSAGLFSWNPALSLSDSGVSLPALFVNRAAAALGTAKEAGKNRVVPFDDIVRSHGRISEVLPGGAEARINLGHFQGIEPGMCFEVIDRIFNGRNTYVSSSGREKIGIMPERVKAIIRVNRGRAGRDEIQERMSFAAIIKALRENAGDPCECWPVQNGDILRLLDCATGTTDHLLQEFNTPPRVEPAWFGSAMTVSKSSLGLEILERYAARVQENLEAILTGQCAGVVVRRHGNRIRILAEGVQWEGLEKSTAAAGRRIESASGGEIRLVSAFCGFPGIQVAKEGDAFRGVKDSHVSPMEKTEALLALPEALSQTSPVLFGAKWANLIGRNHFARGDLTGAEASFNEAARLDPGAWQPIGNLGVIFMRRQLHGKAMAFFRRALEISGGGKGDIHNNMGYLLLRTGGDPAEATRHIRKAMELDGPSADALNALALALLQIPGEGGAASEAAEMALLMEPATPEYIDTLVTALLAAGRPREALATAEKLMSCPAPILAGSPEFTVHAVEAAKAAGDEDRIRQWSKSAEFDYLIGKAGHE